MDPEEFERIKEAEKAHLREIRKLKDTLRRAQQRNRVRGALSDMNADALMRETDDSIEALTRDALEAEARLTVAMEHADLQPPEEMIGPTELDEEELRKARALELIRQLKEEAAADEASPPAGPSATEPEPPAREKTIGRMRRTGRNLSDDNSSHSA